MRVNLTAAEVSLTPSAIISDTPQLKLQLNVSAAASHPGVPELRNRPLGGSKGPHSSELENIKFMKQGW